MVYLPPAFTEKRPEVLMEHIERYDFGLLVTHGVEGLVASHIPFLIEREGEQLHLHGHLARPNPQVADVADAVSGLRAAAPDPDLAAACAFARRRRLGPFRRSAADHARELGSFARAGFSRRVAEAVLACPDIAGVEALARGEPD